MIKVVIKATKDGKIKRTIDNQFLKIEDQIKDSPGGMIFDATLLVKNIKMTENEIIKECAEEMIKKKFPGDVIIKNGDTIVAILHNTYND